MQEHQTRPLQSTATPQPDDVSGFVVMPLRHAIIGPKRVARDDRGDEGAKRFGPLPGEIFPDEARFGSFN